MPIERTSNQAEGMIRLVAFPEGTDPAALEGVRELVERHGGELFSWRIPGTPPEVAPKGIEKTPGVCGGDACIKGTRIPVWLLEQSRRLGIREVDLLRGYPSLNASDLATAWLYAIVHVAEIDARIVAEEALDDAVV